MKKYVLDNIEDNEKNLEQIGNLINKGKIVIFPTETVYGIGTNGLSSEAVKKIFEIKKRTIKNPINLLVSDVEMIESIAKDISELEYKIIEKFFPGPLTLILKRNENVVPNIVTAGQDTVGVRIPQNEIARKLVEYAKVPIAAPSANISGKLSATNVEDISEEFNDVDYIIDGGESNIGIESTIVKVENNIIYILRLGSITKEQLENETEAIVKYKNEDSNKFKHYIPNNRCVLVYSEDRTRMIDKINEIVKKYDNPVIISTTENINTYKCENVLDIGKQTDLNTVSKNLFKVLRKADKINPDIIVIQGIKKEEIGIAIMDRLIKACQNNYIEI